MFGKNKWILDLVLSIVREKTVTNFSCMDLHQSFTNNMRDKVKRYVMQYNLFKIVEFETKSEKKEKRITF